MQDFSRFGDAKSVFHFFNEISKIPHGSGNTAKIAEYLVNFANERGLYVRCDEAFNVIIKKAATATLEDRPTIILQGHTDMVIATAPDCNKDMASEGLDLYIDGDFLKARGTTLGGDDGVAVAYALALLDSNDIPHPALEVIFTSDEEIGLLGAVALDPFDIDGRIMINIDSDSEGIFTAGCAGGVRIDVALPMKPPCYSARGTKIRLSGLKGGHSGIEIDEGRENAIKILGELLYSLYTDDKSMKLASLSGGNADNAIPRYAECLIEARLKDKAIVIAQALKERYGATEPEIEFSFSDTDNTSFFDCVDSNALISLIHSEPSGVIAMSNEIPGLVETSLNLGIVTLCESGAALAFSVRSAKGAEKEALATRVTKIAENYGATCSYHGAYPAWEYRPTSHLRDVMCEVYRTAYGCDAKVVTIHAGLECGIFADKLPGLDCISIGPDNYDIHTTEERLSIPSTIRVWKFIKEVLRNI